MTANVAIRPQVHLRSAAPDANLLARKRREETVSKFARTLGRHMHWLCDESGYTYSYPIQEPVNKPVFCSGCGKKHLLTPGEMEPSDLEAIKQIKAAGMEDDDVYFMADAIVDRMCYNDVLMVGNVDRFTSDEIKGGSLMSGPKGYTK